MGLESGATLGPADKPGGSGELPDGVLEVIPAEVINIEYSNYGKLVVERGGHVDPSGIGFTRWSSGLSKAARDGMLPYKLLGTSTFDIAEECMSAGGLVIRLLPDGTIAAARTRFRPEAGEGRAGRVFTQSSACRISPDAWRRHAASIGSHLSQLQAEPDVASEQPENWNALPSHTFAAPEHEILALERLDTDARFLAELLTEKRIQGVVVPADRFSDEKSFLEALGRAVETLSLTHPESVADVRVAVGIAGLKSGWTQFTPQKKE